MRKILVAAVAASMLVAGGAAAIWKVNAPPRMATASAASAARRELDSPINVGFEDLLDAGPKLKPSTTALAMNGKRVRIVGFMAEMELPIEGSFYLVPRPLMLDEAGGGTADLPLESVLVVVPAMEEKIVPHVSGALEGVGILEVGNRSDSRGRVSNFRLLLDLEAGATSRHAIDTSSPSH